MNDTKRTIGELFLASSVIIFLLIGCTRHPYRVLDPDEVDRITFGAIAPGQETMFSIRNIGQLIQFDTYRDTTFYVRDDSSLIRRYISLLNKQVPLEGEGSIDMRIFSIVTMKDGLQHMNCYGYARGSLYDGAYMEDNEELFSFLDSLIYASHDIDYWFCRAPVLDIEVNDK